MKVCSTCGGDGFIERASGAEARHECPECGRRPRCVNHFNRRSRVNLDGDELCQECADAWVRAEGQHAAWLEAEGLAEGKAP